MGRNNFFQDFEYGASDEGFCTYEWMVLQIEYFTGIFKAIHPGIYLIFLFDNPCGHDRGIEDRLNVTKMNSGYVGAQRYMHPTNIKQEVGYLDPNKQIFEVGDYQHMLIK